MIKLPVRSWVKLVLFFFFYGNWFSFMIWISATKQFLNQGLHSPIMYCPANFSKHAVSSLGHLNKLSFSNITYPASFFFLPKSMQFLHWALYYISNFILKSPCKFFFQYGPVLPPSRVQMLHSWPDSGSACYLTQQVLYWLVRPTGIFCGQSSSLRIYVNTLPFAYHLELDRICVNVSKSGRMMWRPVEPYNCVSVYTSSLENWSS